MNFRAHLSRQRKLHLVEADLRKSRKVCQQLDLAKNPENGTPVETWFWPEKPVERLLDDEPSSSVVEEQEEDDEDEEGCEFEPHEMLEMLTRYLRGEHVYCIWCGTSFEDEGDLGRNCPGSTREDHDE